MKKLCPAALLVLALASAAQAADKLAVGKAELDPPTAHVLSLVVPAKDADANRNGSVAVFYKKEGDADWKPSMDLFRTYKGQGNNQPFAGMVSNLEPNTAYEIKVVAKDPDGVEGEAEQVLKTRTPALPKRFEATAENTVKVTNFDELQAAVNKAQPGQVILLEKGEYKGKLTLNKLAGSAEKPIVVRGIDRGACILYGSVTIAGCKHTHLEDVTVGHAGKAIQVKDSGGHCEDVVIRGTLLLNIDVGIDAKGGHKNLYIADNVLIGNNVFGDTTNATWNDEGIVVTGQGIDVANNTLAGFGDALGMSHNTDLPNRGIEIHHNLVLWGGDDGIEMDFTDRNGQCHHNLIANCANGFSSQMTWYGPSYIHHNVSYNLERGPYKIKPEREGNDGVFVFNNTTINVGRAYTNFSGQAGTVQFINNLFTGDGKNKDVIRADTSRYKHLTVDYNGYTYDAQFQIGGIFKKNFKDWQASSGQGKHDVLLAGETTFEHIGADFFTQDFRVYRDPHTDFSLAKDSKAVDAGQELPSLTDGFTGKAPDIGAWERGTPATVYGAFASDKTPPGAPAELKAEPVSTTEIKLEWKAAEDAESGVVFYNLYRNGKLATMVVTGTSCTDGGLDEGAEYSYEVAAVNGASYAGPKTAAVKQATKSDTTPPTLDAVLAAGSKNTQIEIVFSEPLEKASAEDAAHYALDNGAKVEKAEMKANGTGVVLTTSALNEGIDYNLAVTGVTDRAKKPNPVADGGKKTFRFVQMELIVDFGVKDGEDIYGKGWTKTIKDTYTGNDPAGPGGMAAKVGGSDAAYNFQGVTSDEKHDFAAGDAVVTTWYNNNPGKSYTFTPMLSFDGTGRRPAGGTWHEFPALTLAPGETATATFTVPEGVAGSFSVVNVNVNIKSGYNSALILDKIELKKK